MGEELEYIQVWKSGNKEIKCFSIFNIQELGKQHKQVHQIVEQKQTVSLAVKSHSKLEYFFSHSQCVVEEPNLSPIYKRWIDLSPF